MKHLRSETVERNFEDIAILTGGQFFSEDLGIKLENITLDS